MESDLKFNKKALTRIANRCYDLLSMAPSKKEALSRIALTASTEFGEYFGPIILENPDEISVNLIELLDQIVFEIEENDSGENNIREYIIDDLYLRINIYLEIIKDRDLYKKSLSSRLLTYDDTIIIKKYKMHEYIPDLLREFHDQANLQKAILKTLLTFDAEDLLNFYYQIIQGVYCLDIKSLALIGLKGFNGRFSNWHKLRNGDDDLNRLISYTKSFNILNIEKNELPVDHNTLFFVINYIEQYIGEFAEESAYNWILSVFKVFSQIEIDNSLFTSIYTSISNIMISFDIDYLKKFSKSEENLISFIHFIDRFPRSIFDRITVKLDVLDREFTSPVNSLISSEKIILDEVNSNILSYLLWNSPRGL